MENVPSSIPPKKKNIFCIFWTKTIQLRLVLSGFLFVKKISRQSFVELCTQVIVKARQEIAIANQYNGFVRYEREIVKKDSLYSLRAILNETAADNYHLRHDIIQYFGMGCCAELTDYLVSEIANELNKLGTSASLSTVQSQIADHVFLQVSIHLEDEEISSRWEIDAWDPRVLDISIHPTNGAIKNDEHLYTYGMHPIHFHSVNSTALKETEKESAARILCLLSLEKPVPGQLNVKNTVRKRVIKSLPGMHPDHPIENARQKQMLPYYGTIQSVQKASIWQKNNRSIPKDPDQLVKRTNPSR